MFRENARIAALNGQLVDGNQSPLVRAMVKLNVFENATRRGKISAMRTSDRHRAVAGFRQIFHDRLLGEGPNAAP